MEPPKAVTIDKKLGNIYFTGKCLLKGPYEIKDNEVFGAEGGNKAMRESLQKKKGIKINIMALTDSLRFNRKSRLGKKPPHKNVKYQHIKHYYQFAQQENIVILALQKPKTPKQYIALKFAEVAATAKFCDLVQYASIASNHNLKNAAPPPEAPTLNASIPASPETPLAPQSLPKKTADSPSVTQTPSPSESRSSSSSPSRCRNSAIPRTSITEIVERNTALSATQSRDESTERDSQLSSTHANYLPEVGLVESCATPTRQNSTPKPRSVSPQLQTLPESPSFQRSSCPIQKHQSLSSESEANRTNNICPTCSHENPCVVNAATSPVPSGLSKKSDANPIEHYSTANGNISPQLQAYGVTAVVEYGPDHSKLSECNHDPQIVEEILCIDKSRRSVASATPDYRTSSSSSFSERYQISLGATPNQSSENQMILTSNKFHPLSVLTNNRSSENSFNDMCSICGSVGEGGPMHLKILRVDVDGQPKISPDGAVYMYSSTKVVKKEKSEEVNGYQRKLSHPHDDCKNGKKEKRSSIQIWRLDDSSSSDSDDSISERSNKRGIFNVRQI
uniref:Trematode PH-like domain-containing protein n=1 Tax=Schistocephalus solidus TaxID=70667 RepID=A0A0X3NP61_SCHSO